MSIAIEKDENVTHCDGLRMTSLLDGEKDQSVKTRNQESLSYAPSKDMGKMK